MLCPHCGARNALGSRHCAACHYSFTRFINSGDSPASPRAVQRVRPARRVRQAPVPSPAPRAGQTVRYPTPVADDDDWYADDRYLPDEPVDVAEPAYSRRRSRRRGFARGCIWAFGIGSLLLVAAIVAVLLASNLYVKPMVRDAALEDLRQGVRAEVSSQLATQLPQQTSGEIVISAGEINERLNDGGLGPIDDADVTITPAGINVEMSAYGLNGTYRTTVTAQNGSVVIERGSLDGPLSLAIPQDELADAVNQEIAAALAESGYHVESATMTDGAVVLIVRS